MAAPGTRYNPLNPYKTIAGQTWTGGARANAISAINNPAAAATAMAQAKNKAMMGMGAMPGTEQELYGQVAQPSYGMGGTGHGYGGGDSYGQGNPNYHSQIRIGNKPGTMSPASPTSPYASPSGSGLGAFYAMQQKGAGAFNALQDTAAVQNYVGGFPNTAHAATVNAFPGAFPMAPQAGQSQHPASDPFDYTPFPVAGKAKGGTVYQPKPYLVGERGPEIYKSEDGQHQMIGMNGPEIRTFPADGKIIPNKDLKKYLPNILEARAAGGGVQGSNYRMPVPVNMGPPQPQMMQQQQQISPFAMSYLPQFQQQPQMSLEAQQFASDPNAPESPWAMARYIRMGLQNAARQHLTAEAGRKAVAESYAKQAIVDGMGYTPPMHPTKGAFSIRTPYGTGISQPGNPGVQPQGQFQVLDITGKPVPNQGMVPMSAPQNDPGAVTFPQIDIMSRLAAARKTPLAALLGGQQ